MSLVHHKKVIGLTLTALAVSLGGLSACGKNESPEALLAEAKQFQQKGDNKAAIIQLKNALAKNGNDVGARLLLAQIYNQSGDGASAEKEVRKAISLGLPAEQAVPVLAAALLRQGQFQKVLDETAAQNAKGGADIATLRGDALLGLNRPAEAHDAYAAALKTTPADTKALLGMARWALAQNDGAAAEDYVEQALKSHPKDLDALGFKGILKHALGKLDQAKAAYTEVLTINPNDGAAHLQLAFMNIEEKKFDVAQSEIAAAKKAAPSNLLNNYAQALLDFTQGKSAPALESIQQVLSVAPEHMPSVLLAGAIQYALGSQQQAEQHLKKYVDRFPDNLYARKLLASVLIRQGRGKDAQALVAPYAKDTRDAQLLAIAGEAALGARDFNAATNYLTRASAIAPTTAGLHTALGMSKLNQGDYALGVAELERATTLDSKSPNAGVLLIMTHMRLGQYDKAVAAATALEKTAPTNPLVFNLKGGAYLGKKDFAAARANFEKALSLQPTYFPAVSNLASLDVRDKKPEVAQKRYESFINANPKNAEAMIALADFHNAQGKPAEATTWLERAANVDPNALPPALRLSAHYLNAGDKAKALTLLRKMQVANPDNSQLLDLLGQTQLANNDKAGALETFSRLSGRNPNSAPAQLRVAQAQFALDNRPAAVAALRKAVSLQADYLDAQVMLFNHEARFGSAEQALAIARQVQKARPRQDIGFILEGDLMVAQKKPAQAVAPYEKAQALAKSPTTLIKVAEALRLAGRQKDADARVAQWRREVPADLTVPLYVGDRLLADKKYPQAVEQLQAMQKIAAKSPVVLNNLAVAYQLAKDGRALATAEQALQYGPGSPAVMDTLGWILVEQGNTARAVPLLQKAIALSPQAEFRYHLAVALAKTDKAGARKELEAALASKQTFAQIEDARALLRQL